MGRWHVGNENGTCPETAEEPHNSAISVHMINADSKDFKRCMREDGDVLDDQSNKKDGGAGRRVCLYIEKRIVKDT